MKNENERVFDILSTGLPPIDTVFCEIKRISGDSLAGYRSTAILNNTETGVLTPAQYRIVSEKNQLCCKLAQNQISAVCAILAQNLLGEKLRKAEWISIYIPFKLLKKDGALKAFRAAEKQYGAEIAKKLCFEFSSSILYEDKEIVKEALVNLRAAGIKLMLTEFGSEFCPAMRLVGLNFDYIMLDSSLRDNFNGEKSAAANIIALAGSTGAEIITEGVAAREKLDYAFEIGCTDYCAAKSATARDIAGYREAAV